ncbi:MAG TPA: tetratricopeptide repeat protein [Patescibacteria group bacterium]|nr:tetratricopeptide repeat protein [Patescibacteria group bacterium]
MPVLRSRGPVWCACALLLIASSGAARAETTDPSGCARGLAALDAGGQVVFETVALLTGRPGVAVAPLHALERGGVRWSRLELRPLTGGPGTPVAGVGTRPEQDLALLGVDATAGCAARSPEAADAPPAAGSAVRLFRERHGFRSGAIGGRVERVVDLADGGRVALLHLLDEGGSDPGLVVDDGGRFLGVTGPAPVGADPALAAVVLAPPAALDLEGDGRGWKPAREAIEPRPAPLVLSTTPGLVGQALVLEGRDGGVRGIALLSVAIARDEGVAAVHLERGVLEFGAGQLPAATSDFQRAAAIDPSSRLARFNLGVCLGAAGRYAEAAEAFLQARDLDPAHARTRYQLALALKVLRRDTEARREYDALLALDPALADDLKATLGF